MHTPPLATCLELFSNLEASGIGHCHWKSNEHLGAALAGQTDLDLLVASQRAADVDAVLRRLGCRPFRAPPWATYPGIFDWLGFDQETGHLFHVHLHHTLRIGRRFVKEHHLPWEETILATSVVDPVHAVRTTHPALELVLLLFRAALRADLRALTGFAPSMPRGMRRELDDLLGRVKVADVEDFARRLLPPGDAAALVELVRDGEVAEARALRHLRVLALRAVRDEAPMSGTAAAARTRVRRARSFVARAAWRLNLTPQVAKRLPERGIMVALIGSDGAGKSTLAAALAEWLAWKADVRALYLGTGRGRVGLRVRLLQRLAGATASRSRPAAVSGAGRMRTRIPLPGLLRDLGTGLLNHAVAAERLRKLRMADALRDAGGILVTDRFPQVQFPGIYDGPRTTRMDRESPVRRALAEREARLFEAMLERAPDVVIKLHVPVEVALERRPGDRGDTIRRKVDLTAALTFPGSQVHDVDASRPLEEVLLECKRILWDAL